MIDMASWMVAFGSIVNGSSIHDILGGGDLRLEARIMVAQFEHMPQYMPLG